MLILNSKCFFHFLHWLLRNCLTHWSALTSECEVYPFCSSDALTFPSLFINALFPEQSTRKSVVNFHTVKGSLKRHSVNDTSESFRRFCLPCCFAWWIQCIFSLAQKRHCPTWHLLPFVHSDKMVTWFDSSALSPCPLQGVCLHILHTLHTLKSTSLCKGLNSLNKVKLSS